MQKLEKLCILDCSCRETLFENKLTVKLFHGIVECDVYHLPSGEFPENYMRNYIGCVITGSKSCCMDETLPYRDTLMQMIRDMITADFPLLGICFGAQIIALTHFGSSHVTTMKKLDQLPEYGFKWIELLKQDPIFQNCPSKFKAAVSHEDCFYDIESTARTTQWKYHAFRIEDKKIWGLQFHPEFTGQDALDVYNSFVNRTVVHEFDGCSDEIVSKQIATNFYNLCIEGSK
jgi:GMP synthase-like glutamine amidotransferase